jgi:hypothetical protein
MVERVYILASKFGIGEPLPGGLRHKHRETVRIVQRAIMCVISFIANEITWRTFSPNPLK